MELRLIRNLILLLCASLTLGETAAPGAQREVWDGSNTRVLFLRSFSQGRPVMDRYIDGFVTELRKLGWNTDDIHIEALDSNGYYSPELRRIKSHYLAKAMEEHPPALVVTLQQPALNFLLGELSGYIAKQPLLIANGRLPERSRPTSQIVTQFASADYKRALQQGIELFPATKRVLVISGAGEQDVVSRAGVQAIADSFRGKLDFEFTNAMNLQDILARAASLPPDSLVLLGNLNQDVTGQRYSSYDANGYVMDVANAPVFTTFRYRVGEGVVGGVVNDTYAMGVQAAHCVYDHFRGGAPWPAGITKLPVQAHPAYDWKQLTRWKAHFDALPQDAELINVPPSLWRDYRNTTLATLGAIIVLLALSMALAFQSRRRLLAEKLHFAVARHRQAVLDNVADGIVTMNARGSIQSFNEAAARIFGVSQKDVIDQNICVLVPAFCEGPRDVERNDSFELAMQALVGNSKEMEGKRKDGAPFPLHFSVSQIIQDDRILYVGLFQDISERKKAEQEIQHLAYFDSLTQLPNRRLFLDRLAHALIAKRRSRQFGGLILVNIDHFKNLNDTLGHVWGDEMLREAARRLQKIVRAEDTVARLGSDEFVVMFENAGADADTSAKHADVVVAKILKSFQEKFDLAGQQFHGFSSLGVVIFGDDTLTSEVLMMQADMAMSHAKADGGNCHRFFDVNLQAKLTAHISLGNDLHRALERHEFFLLYQPQVDGNGDLVGVEALLRWHHPVRGVVPPSEFVPLAEQSGMVSDMGRWVMSAACTKLATWRGRPKFAGLTMAINVSALEFRHPQFVNHLFQVIDSTGVDPSRLKLELTESVMEDDLGSLAQKMNTIKQRGVGFSLDDFGTGYSSLSYLRQLPLDQLKIDKSFVADVKDDPNAAAIVRTIVALGKVMGMSIIAEGVETLAQQEFLLECGCHAFQGYLISKPLNEPGLQEILENGL